MSLTVKVALFTGTNNPFEFRRFSLREDEIEYRCLERKIKERFPESHLFMWKDTDGDLITFSSDAELKEAIDFVTDGVLKVFVAEKQPGHTAVDNGQMNEIQHGEDQTKHFDKKWKRRLHKQCVKLGHSIEEGDTQRLQRQEEKWIKRQEEKRAFRENCRRGNLDCLQLRLDRLNAKRAALNIEDQPTDGMPKSAEHEIAEHLDRRIERVKARLEHLKLVGNDDPRDDNGQSFQLKLGPRVHGQESGMRPRHSKRIGRVHLRRNHAVIKIPLPLSDELNRPRKDENGKHQNRSHEFLQQRLNRLKAKLTALQMAKQPSGIPTAEREIADHLEARIKQVNAKLDNLKEGSDKLPWTGHYRGAGGVDRVKLRKNHAIVKVPLKLCKGPTNRKLKLRIESVLANQEGDKNPEKQTK